MTLPTVRIAQEVTFLCLEARVMIGLCPIEVEGTH